MIQIVNTLISALTTARQGGTAGDLGAVGYIPMTELNASSLTAIVGGDGEGDGPDGGPRGGWKATSTSST